MFEIQGNPRVVTTSGSAAIPVEGDFERGWDNERCLKYESSPAKGIPAHFELLSHTGSVLARIDVLEGQRRTDAIVKLFVNDQLPPTDVQIGIMWGRLGERMALARTDGVIVEHA